ncbi:hypothetical protein BG005_008972 [Podila minutissima]|nr:hypothetical protein BG005_008972 [Podila minutissima]
MDNMLLPEIVHQIGLSIQIWFPPDRLQSSLARRGHRFDPRPLIACIKTCRLFYITLTPLLWEVYHEYHMAGWTIPLKVLQSKSHHIRYLTLYTSWPPRTIQSTQLRELRITSSVLEKHLYLVHSNPQLSILSFHMDGQGYRNVKSTIEVLSRLTVLQLGGLRSHSADLEQLFKKNAALEELTVINPRPLQSDGCQPLASLTWLAVESWGEENQSGQVNLIRRCPNLTTVTLDLKNGLLDPVSRALREHCPRLERIQCTHRSFGASRHTDEAQDADLGTLIQATPRLLHFTCKAMTLTNVVCQALLRHATWMDTLELHLFIGDEESVRNVGRLLTSCSSLRRLKVKYEQSMETADLGWLGDSWGCRNLESIDLAGLTKFTGLGIPRTGNYINNDDTGTNWYRKIKEIVAITTNKLDGWPAEVPLYHSRSRDQAFLDSFASEGWVHRPYFFEHGGMHPALSTEAWKLRDWVFERVGRLPRIHRIQVELYEYLRSDRITMDEYRRQYYW